MGISPWIWELVYTYPGRVAQTCLWRKHSVSCNKLETIKDLVTPRVLWHYLSKMWHIKNWLHATVINTKRISSSLKFMVSKAMFQWLLVILHLPAYNLSKSITFKLINGHHSNHINFYHMGTMNYYILRYNKCWWPDFNSG